MFSCFSTLESLVEKTILSPLNCLCSFIKDQLTLYLCLFCSTGLSLLSPIPHHPDFYSFMSSLEIKKCQSLDFVLSFSVLC